MQVIDTRLPKACFVEAGQVIQLSDKDTHLPTGPFYLVVAIGDKVAEHKVKSNGLYSDPRTHLLVNLETGVLRGMPHLSSRVDIIGNARLVLQDHPRVY